MPKQTWKKREPSYRPFVDARDLAAGAKVSHKGQTYTLRSVRPFVTNKGYETGIATWETRCWSCGALFTFECGGNAFTQKRRRCDAHKHEDATPITSKRPHWERDLQPSDRGKHLPFPLQLAKGD
ncbi:MAG: hypothetical protein AAGD43_03225 [Pseudomonadota bacterium]